MSNPSLLQLKLRSFFQETYARMSLYALALLFLLVLSSDFLANDKPLVVYYKNNWYFPVLYIYPETTFGGDFQTEADYLDPYVIDKIKSNGWYLMPPIPYSYDTHDFLANKPQPAAPSWQHFLGTDDQGRDILARLLYGLRTSMLFGFILSALSLVIGVVIGSMCGYFGALTDLFLQRFLEIWSGLPTLYLLIILSSFIQPNFFWLMLVMLLFSWTRFVGVVRAEFLRARGLSYVAAARALGVSDIKIIFKHILPNAMVATLSLLPWHIIGGIMSLTSLDFLGFGMPIGSASLGELVSQAKSNLHAPWIAFGVFGALFILMGLLVFIGEGIRDALDPHMVDADA